MIPFGVEGYVHLSLLGAWSVVWALWDIAMDNIVTSGLVGVLVSSLTCIYFQQYTIQSLELHT